MDAVQSKQKTGDGAEGVRTSETPHDPCRHHHGGYSQDRDCDAPAERVDPEEVLAGGDHPLTDRWVDDETGPSAERFDNAPIVAGLHHQLFVIVDLIDLHTEAQVGPGIFRVIRLVEDNGVGLTQPRQTSHGGNGAGGEWSQPAPPAVRRECRGQAIGERRRTAIRSSGHGRHPHIVGATGWVSDRSLASRLDHARGNTGR